MCYRLSKCSKPARFHKCFCRVVHIVFDDWNKQVSRYGDIDLYPHCILRSTPKFLNLEVSLESFEERFHLPAIFVECGNKSGAWHLCLYCTLTDNAVKLTSIISRKVTNWVKTNLSENICGYHKNHREVKFLSLSALKISVNNYISIISKNIPQF